MDLPIRTSPVVQIIGQPGAGKTTLVAGLVRYFRDLGLCVGTLKHSSHAHELDKTGKDSHVHRTAGAEPAAMVNAAMAAIYLPPSERTRPEFLIETYFQDLDVVIVEGYISGPWPKVEIWRKECQKAPLFTLKTLQNLRAVTAPLLNEDAAQRADEMDIPVIPLDDIPALAKAILALAY